MGAWTVVGSPERPFSKVVKVHELSGVTSLPHCVDGSLPIERVAKGPARTASRLISED